MEIWSFGPQWAVTVVGLRELFNQKSKSNISVIIPPIIHIAIRALQFK